MTWNLRWVGLSVTWLLHLSAVAQPNLEVGTVNAVPDSNTIVPVFIEDAQQISALQLEVHFDGSHIALSSVNKLPGGSALADHVISSTLQPGSQGADQILRLFVFSDTLARLESSGFLLLLSFAVGADAPLGDFVSLRVPQSALSASDEEGNPVPITASGGSIIFRQEGNVPSAGENELIFAQVGNGSFPGGRFGVILVAVNRAQASVDARLEFFQSDGSPMMVTLTDQRTDSAFDLSLEPEGSIFLETDGQGPLTVGYVRLVSTAPLGGTLLFFLRDPTGGLISEAGVGAVVRKNSIHYDSGWYFRLERPRLLGWPCCSCSFSFRPSVWSPSHGFTAGPCCG